MYAIKLRGIFEEKKRGNWNVEIVNKIKKFALQKGNDKISWKKKALNFKDSLLRILKYFGNF